MSQVAQDLGIHVNLFESPRGNCRWRGSEIGRVAGYLQSRPPMGKEYRGFDGECL